MTEGYPEIHLCPVCGKENLPMATRCVHCGSEMETLFTLDGLVSTPEEDDRSSLSEIIANMQNDPALQTPVEPEIQPEELTEDQPNEPAEGIAPTADWLSKVRQRAQGDEDAVGRLVSGLNAIDAARSEEASASVEGEFTAWISRIREKNQQENRSRVRQLPEDPSDSDEVPEWLRRIRALRPPQEEELKDERGADSTYPDGTPREWTEEALMELRRQALAEDADQEDEGLLEVSEGGAQGAQSDALLGDSAPEQDEAASQEAEDVFHNIPDDEDVHAIATPADDASGEPEGEVFAVDEDEQLGEAPEESAEEEPPLEDGLQPAEPGDDEPIIMDEAVEPGQVLPQDDLAEHEEPADSSSVLQDLLLLRDQQDRASLLAALIEQEGRVTVGYQPPRQPAAKGGRVVVALLLLIGLIVSILLGPAASPAGLSSSAPGLALTGRVEALAKDDAVLVVLDYQPAASRELEALAAPLLGSMADKGVDLTFLTSQPSGLFLAQPLFEKAGLPTETRVEFLPGSYLSLISWAMNPSAPPEFNAALSGSLRKVPSLSSFRMILLVSDSSEGIRGWLEHIAPWLDKSPIAAVTTQMEAPVLAPYFAADQLIGYASTLADGTMAAEAAFNFRAYRVGLLLMLAMLLLGVISKADADFQRKEKERAQ